MNRKQYNKHLKLKQGKHYLQKLRIIVLNVDNISDKFTEIEWLITNTHPDQMLISETKLEGKDQEIDNLLKRVECTSAYLRDHNKGGDAIMIPIKNNYNKFEIKNTPSVVFVQFDFTIWIYIYFILNHYAPVI